MFDKYIRKLPPGSITRSTVCQYCAVGCGYRALLTPSVPQTGEEVDVVTSSYISPAMREEIYFQGKKYHASIVPDARCELNKGNHSVRGGSQGGDLVSVKPKRERKKDDRLRSPLVRCKDGQLHKVSWKEINEVIAELTIKATSLKKDEEDQLKAEKPEGLGVKIFEYQYLENTYAATKLFYRAIGTPNLAYHDRPSAAGSSPGMKDAGIGPHNFAYEDMRKVDSLFIVGSNPYENQSVFFMQNLTGKEMIVLDPRKTATAQYAETTGGIHLQPTRLGADSLVLFAIARSLMEEFSDQDIHPKIAKNQHDIKEIIEKSIEKKKFRRASRALSFQEFKDFLKGDDTYTLENAAKVSGICLSLLKETVRRMSKNPPGRNRLPIVGTLYEKGLIWGFNYHNTAAIASIGLLLWRPSMPAPLVGRCGGHQKGWAEAKGFVQGFTLRNQCKSSKEESYPYSNAVDTYTEGKLNQLRPDYPLKNPVFPVKHNLDSHVFGPDEAMVIPDSEKNGRVKLKNGVETCAEPDVQLLWIIGGNYLGQINDCQRKRKKLKSRFKDEYPSKAEVSEILRSFKARMDAGGVVVVHQDIFPNATTELSDIVLPAAGWGEDTFIRYNAERRLRLYERFQDSPLHEKDKGKLSDQDPYESRDSFCYSPKPDWVIFRDIAQKIINSKGGSRALSEFSWTNTGAIADELAEEKKTQENNYYIGRSNRSNWLNPILKFADECGVENERIHTVLGKNSSGNTSYLGKEHYSVVSNGSQIAGNGVTSNGVLLPAIYDKESLKLQGTLRLTPRKENQNPEFNFVWASWAEIDDWFKKFEPGENELAITCGRVNHLWNNMSNHIRNEHIRERYPEDMPGTILEVHPDWAKEKGFVNGQVVEVRDGNQFFIAIISCQNSVSRGTAFALFSYPVYNKVTENFEFDGYVNNIMFGYFDGINPVGTLKYGKGTVTALERPIFSSEKRLGPSYSQRNQIVVEPEGLREGIGKKTGQWLYHRRLDWRMRELIVSRGLPRAFTHTGQERQITMLNPDDTLSYLKSKLRGVFGMMLDVMKWPSYDTKNPETGEILKAGAWDQWDGVDRDIALEWAASLEVDPEMSSPKEMDPPCVDSAIKEFFLEWSKHLTGFDNLEKDHSESLLLRLLRRKPETHKILLKICSENHLKEMDSFQYEVLRVKFKEFAEIITILWYNGSFHNEHGYPAEEGSDKGFGSMYEDHYRKGLIWKAMGVEPQGYRTSTKNWNEPQENIDE